jgi:HTH-type transcriptional regulator, transcriptional repressor of NAD biosynthesis genes
MVKAFVFGKFLPFHQGHQAMIAFALTRCDRLTVLVCCSDTEEMPPLARKAWIADTFKGDSRIEVKVFCYAERDYPNTSASSREVSKIWSGKFKQLFPDHTLLVTSEPYGCFVAEYMGIAHVPFDPGRNRFPVSATVIRNNPSAHWRYLPDPVKPYFLTKVVLLGTESTGKTTLTQRLARHFSAAHVLEAGRDLIKNSQDFRFQDLYAVAREHASRIAACPIENSPLLFIDTDVHITMSYASFMFRKELQLPRQVLDHNKAAIYLYLNNDVPHQQDGTRLPEEARNLLDLSHRQTLALNGISFHEIKGNWQERFEQCVAIVNQALKASPGAAEAHPLPAAVD